MFRSALVLAAAAAVATATPAAAVQTIFASFSQINTASTLRFVNNGNGIPDSAVDGPGGTLTTTTTATATQPGDADVSFSFLLDGLAATFTAVPARFALDAVVADGGARVVDLGSFDFLFQPGITGQFSFTTVAPISFRGSVFAPGTELLRGDFDNAFIAGTAGSRSAGFSSGGAGTLTYSSPFLGFAGGGFDEFQISLSALSSQLAAGSGGVPGGPARALGSFRSSASGLFSGDPILDGGAGGVPEPQSWALLLVGFVMVGASIRRRDRWRAVSA